MVGRAPIAPPTREHNRIVSRGFGPSAGVGSYWLPRRRPPMCRTVTAACCRWAPVRPLSVSAQTLRRQRLPGREVPPWPDHRLCPGQCRDRQAFQPPQVCRPAKTMDRRAHHRLAQPLSTPRQGLGMSQPLQSRLPALGIRPPHAPKTLPKYKMIPDGLLEQIADVGTERDRHAAHIGMASNERFDGQDRCQHVRLGSKFACVPCG